jgi:TetR/AcrR family transcriptional regulator of autoinduction and epiphytic fitness
VHEAGDIETAIEAGPSPEDGRNARARRTHDAIVAAVIELLEAGDLRPTAEAIAERAGVSPRSVFQHFPERDGLIAAVAQRQAERVLALVRLLPTEGPLEARLDAFVDQRARVWEFVTPVRRSAILMEPFSEDVAAWLARFRVLSRAETERVFAPELEGMDGARRARVGRALAAIGEWTFWETLRAHQGLSPKDARAAVREAVAALVGGGADPEGPVPR